jgi:hypothetical protein
MKDMHSRFSEVSVSGIEYLETQQLHTRLLLTVGRGPQSQTWVLARLAQNRPDDLGFGDYLDEGDSSDKIIRVGINHPSVLCSRHDGTSQNFPW